VHDPALDVTQEEHHVEPVQSETTTTTTATTEVLAPFTAETARQMFSVRAKAPNGEGVDVSLVRTYYHPDVLFRDAIQEVRGRDAVVEMLLRFAQRCKELRVHVHNVVQDGPVIFVEWRMEIVVNPRLPMLWNDGCTRLLVGDDGLVIDHRDYFDLWGDMIDAFPRASKVYRKIVAHME
jgi:limonene-1,2-epoxide hydrolase